MVFTANNVGGVLGRMAPILDATVTFSANNVGGVLGRSSVILDPAAVPATQTISPAAVALAIAVSTPTVSPSGSVAIAPAAVGLAMTVVDPTVSPSGAVTLSPAAIAITATPVSPSIQIVFRYRTGARWPPILCVSPIEIACGAQPSLQRRADGSYVLVE